MYIISTKKHIYTNEEIIKILEIDSDDIISEYTSEEIIKIFGIPKKLGKKKYYYYNEALDGCSYVKNIWLANIREGDIDYKVIISEKISEYSIDDNSHKNIELILYIDKKFIQPLKNFMDRKLNREICILEIELQ